MDLTTAQRNHNRLNDRYGKHQHLCEACGGRYTHATADCALVTYDGKCVGCAS